MSNFLAVATVTAALQDLLSTAVSRDFAGAVVSTKRPVADDPLDEARINIFLYYAVPNGYAGNQDLPTRNGEGKLVSTPRAAFDLHYILSFYGSETELVPERLMGLAVSVLHGQPVLTGASIRALISEAKGNKSFLQDSDLADEVERVKFTPMVLDIFDLSRLWSDMVHAPYTLSVFYRASVVLINGRSTAAPALPVRERRLQVASVPHLRIDSVTIPDTPGGLFVVTGSGLAGGDTRVRLGDLEITPEITGDERLEFRITPEVEAGVRAVRITKRLGMGEPDELPSAVESNTAVVVIRPRIETLRLIRGGPQRPPVLRAGVQPPAGAQQKVRLLLSRALETDPRGARDSVVLSPSSFEKGAVEFAVADVTPGKYLARIQVDGAESKLDVDASGLYAGPFVEIPK